MATSVRAEAASDSLTAVLMAGKGDRLPVSAFPVDGTWPVGTAKWEKRNLALEIPVWDQSICIQCNQCALVCPHAAIRAKVYDEGALAGAPQTFKSTPYKGLEFKGRAYTIQVAPEDCTGCHLCVNVCPAKDRTNPRHKAIDMHPQAPLRDPGDIPVDRHDVFQMDRRPAIQADHLEFRVIDHQLAAGVLRLAIDDDLLPRGDHVVDEGHVEPAAGHLAGAEDAAGTVHHHRFVKLPPRTEGALHRIDHRPAQADRGAAGLGGKGIESTAVLVAPRQPFEQVARGVQPGSSEGDDFLRREEIHGCERCGRRDQGKASGCLRVWSQSG